MSLNFLSSNFWKDVGWQFGIWFQIEAYEIKMHALKVIISQSGLKSNKNAHRQCN